MRSRRVGVVATCYPRWPGDYAGAFVADRVRALARDGARVEVMCAGEVGGPAHEQRDGTAITRIPSALFYRRGEGAPEILSGGGRRTGMAARATPTRSRGGGPPGPPVTDRDAAAPWADAIGFSLALLREVSRRAHAWDAVETHFLVPCGLAVALVAPRTSHSAWAHSGDVALLERLPAGLGRALARRLAASGADLMFVSRDLQARFGALAGRSCGRFAALPVDEALFHPARADERARLRDHLGLDRFTVFSAGRLVPVKGFDVLVDAGTLALAGRGAAAAPIEVVIAGEGPEHDALASRAAAAGLPLRLLGAIPRAEVAAWMRAADLYAQPSRVLPDGRSEGLPHTLAEARASGTPVLAARAGGMSEATWTTLLPPDDASAWAVALARAAGLTAGA